MQTEISLKNVRHLRMYALASFSDVSEIDAETGTVLAEPDFKLCHAEMSATETCVQECFDRNTTGVRVYIFSDSQTALKSSTHRLVSPN